MAKTAALVRSAPPIIWQLPKRRAPGRFRRAGAVAKRGARAVGRRAAKQVPEMSLTIAGGALGYAQAKGWLNKIPTIGGSRALTIGVAGYATRRLTSNPTARLVGLVAMVVGAFDFGKIQGGAKSSLEGDAGDDF